MKRNIVVMFVLVVLSMAIFAGTASAAEEPFVFGIAMPQLDNDGFKANRVGFDLFSEEYGVEIRVTDAKSNAETQVQQVEDFITQGVDAIIFCPVDSNADAIAVTKANEAGIPIVSFDRNVVSGDLLALVESNNYSHGAKGAELMAEAGKAQGLEPSDIYCLELLGAQSSSAGLERHQGFNDKAKELGINIVAEMPTEWNMDTAYNCVLDGLQTYPEMNAVYMASDNAMFQGVESALIQAGRYVEMGEEGHVIVTSTDGGPLMLKAIRNKTADATAAQSKLYMSEEAMNAAYKYLRGEMEPGLVIKIDPTAVTLENVDDKSLWANAIAAMAE